MRTFTSALLSLKNRQLSFYPAVLLAVTALPAAAQGGLDAALTEEQQKLKAPAISVAVMDKGSIVYAKGFGLADVENRVPATPQTRFRTASLAKTLTAVAVLQLHERGAIDLDAPIQRACPAFPEKPWPVTARQLLGHLAGVRHYAKAGESTGTEHFFTVTDSLRLFAADALVYEPGTKYTYSTFGFSVLGCAIERVSKMPYAEYMRTHVFEPAGMTHTTVDDVYLVIADRARGYFMLDQRSYDGLPAAGKAIATVGGIYNASLHDTSMKMPGGGLLSTPSDLMAFAAALLDGKLLKPDTRRMMWTSQQTSDGTATGYGMGWGVGTSNGRLIVSHTGNQAGASSLFLIDVETRRALAVMSNLEDADLGGVRRVLTGPLSPATKYGEAVSPPAGRDRAAPRGEPFTLRTAKGSEAVTLHRVEVPEHHGRQDGKHLALAVVRWPAIGAASRPPVLYLAGGPGDAGITAAQIPDTYEALMAIRRTSDVLLLDQRGTGQSAPRLVCPAGGAIPATVFRSADAMQRALEPGLRACVAAWKQRGVDLAAYNTEQSADDVADVAKALNVPRLSLFGFSYGTHLAAAVVRRHADLVDRVVLAGYEGPDDSVKYPAVYDRQVAKIAELAARQPDVAEALPDFTAALKAVLARAEREPFDVAVQQDAGTVRLPIGRDGLLYLLRRDIGDTNDLPFFPKLIHELSRGETALLARLAQRRYQGFSRGVALMGLSMDCASGASASRRAAIAAQEPASIFGVMTNPGGDACAILGVPELPDAFRAPLTTRVPALFLSGTLDSNTPPEQAEGARAGFAQSVHLIVENAGHESTLTPEAVAAVAAFLRGEAVKSRTIAAPAPRFQSLFSKTP